MKPLLKHGFGVVLLGILIWCGVASCAVLFPTPPVLDQSYLRQAIQRDFQTQGLWCAGCSLHIVELSSPGKNLLGHYTSFNVWVFLYTDAGIQEQGYLHIEPEVDRNAPHGYWIYIGRYTPHHAVPARLHELSPERQTIVQSILDDPERYCCPPHP